MSTSRARAVRRVCTECDARGRGYTAGRRSYRPRRWARSPRDRSRRPTATPPGTANESARPPESQVLGAIHHAHAAATEERLDPVTPLAGFRSWEEARVRPTLPDRAMRASARLLRAPIARNSAGQPAAPARISRPRTASGPGSLVGDELEQASVGLAEVHAQTSSLRSGPLDRAELDPYSTRFEMRDRVRDRPVVGEAQIAVARLDRHPRDRRRVKSWAVHVELLVAEAVGPALARPNQLRAEHVSVERFDA